MSAVESGHVRVAVLHPQRTWAEALEHLVVTELGLEVPVAHTSIDWVLGAIGRGDVDVVLLGVAQAGEGPDQVRRLRDARPQPRVIVLNESEDPVELVAMVRAGASGWVRPTVSAHDLGRAVRGVARGETWLPPDLTTIVLERLLSEDDERTESADALAGLSARELEILECLAQGMSRPEIAELFTLSPHTVRTHINHVLRKLDAHSTIAAVLVLRKARIPRQRSGNDTDSSS